MLRICVMFLAHSGGQEHCGRSCRYQACLVPRCVDAMVLTRSECVRFGTTVSCLQSGRSNPTSQVDTVSAVSYHRKPCTCSPGWHSCWRLWWVDCCLSVGFGLFIAYPQILVLQLLHVCLPLLMLAGVFMQALTLSSWASSLRP